MTRMKPDETEFFLPIRVMRGQSIADEHTSSTACLFANCSRHASLVGGSSCNRHPRYASIACRITEATSRQYGEREDIGEIVVFRDWTYIENYTNRRPNFAVQVLTTTGQLNSARIGILSNSLRSSRDWTWSGGIPSHVLCLDHRRIYDLAWLPDRPDGVRQVYEQAREDAWERATDRQDPRLCRVAMIPRGGYGDIILNKDGTYVYYRTNASPNEVGGVQRFTGTVGQCVVDAAKHSILYSEYWDVKGKLPTYNVGYDDYHFVKPGAVEILRKIVDSH